MSTFKDPYEEEEELKDDQLHRLEVIDNLESPEDIQAASELFDPPKEEKTPSDDDPDKTPKGDETDGADKSSQKEEPTTQKQPKDKESVPDKTKTPEQPPQKQEDKAQPDKASGLVEITDDYIAKADEKDRKILEKLKGEKFSPKALEMTVNAQRLIGKRTEQLFSKTDVNKEVQPSQKAEQAPQTKLTPDVEQAKNQMVYARLVKEFPEMPEDPQERKAWLNTLNYEDREEADRFLELKRQVVQEAEQDYNHILNIRENYDKINRSKVDAAVGTIQDFAKNFDADLKTLGYDFTIDNDGNNALIDSIIFDKEGNPKNKIIQIGKAGTLLEGIPIIDEEALVTEFYRLKMPEIMAKIKANAHLEGYKAKDADKEGTPKTLADAATKGQKREIISRITADEVDNIDDPEKINEILANAVIK